MSWERQLGFYAGVVGFCIGNSIAYCGFSSSYLYGLFVIVSVILIFFYFSHRVPFVLYLTFFVIWITIGCLRAEHKIFYNRIHILDDLIDQKVSLEGWVCSEPDMRETNTILHVCIEEFSTKILVRTTQQPKYSYGDELLISGTLISPEGFTSQTGRFFDYKNYLLQDGIRYIVSYPQIIPTGKVEGNILVRKLFLIKQSFITKLQINLPEPHASFMAGLLLGAKSSMGPQLLEDFRVTGVIHIVVLSGFNITIVVWFIMTLLSRFGMITSSVVGSIGILFFAIMTGAGATVVRASLMAFLVIVARMTGNSTLVIRMLFLSGFIMLWHNPMLLLYNPSFQLSFVATFGLITLAPWVSRNLHFIPNPKIGELRELLAATIATQIMVTPLLLYMMGAFPTYSLFANFLILTTVPAAMMIGFLTIMTSYISHTVSQLLSFAAYWILEYSLTIVGVFAGLPAANFEVPPFSFLYVVISYIVMALIGCYVHRELVVIGFKKIVSSQNRKDL